MRGWPISTAADEAIPEASHSARWRPHPVAKEVGDHPSENATASPLRRFEELGVPAWTWVLTAGAATLISTMAAVRGGSHLPAAVVGCLLVASVAPWWLEAAARPLPIWVRVGITGLAVAVLLATGMALLCAWLTALLAVNIALLGRPRQALGYGALMVAVPAFAALGGEDRWWPFASVATAFAFASGWAGRSLTEVVQALRASEAAVSEQARGRERQLIAREVHDLLAHSLTVTMLHLAAARLALYEDLAEADSSLAEAERLGRASLDDIRRVVVLLAHASETEGSGWDLTAELERLAACHRALGHDVRLAIPSAVDHLPPTVVEGLTRVGGEALTNASRHAPGSWIDLRVEVDAATVTLTVHCGLPAPGRTPAPSGSGMGITWMIERAELLGGVLEAGPTRDGWLVRCQVPAEAAAPHVRRAAPR